MDTVLRAEDSKREIAEAVGRTDRIFEDSACFLLHRYPMLRGTNPSARQRLVVKSPNTQTGHGGLQLFISTTMSDRPALLAHVSSSCVSAGAAGAEKTIKFRQDQAISRISV